MEVGTTLGKKLMTIEKTMEMPGKAIAGNTSFSAGNAAQVGWMLPSHSAGATTLSLAEQIADQMASAIIHGQYAPGERLQEQLIAQTFKVSRGPVRDALRILEREGLVVIQARRGASVLQLSYKETLEIFVVRAGLYGIAAEAMAERRAPEVLQGLQERTEILRQTLAENDASRFLDAAYTNGMYIAEHCSNDLLKNFIYSLGRQTLSLTRRAMVVRANQERWYSNWCELAQAISAGEPNVANETGKKLVRDLQQAILELYPKDSA